MTYQFSIPSIPIAQPRARAVAFLGHARMHDAPKSHAIHTYKAIIREYVSKEITAPLTGPIALSVEFVMPRPENHYGSGKNANVLKESAPHWHTSRPDADNLIKGAKDALKGVAWGDDSQVAVYFNVVKRYVCSRDEAPHTLLTIRELTEVL